MIENTFRPSRRIHGKRVRSRYWSGRYTLEKQGHLFTVSLHTTDRSVAQKRLRNLVVEKQQEMLGIIAPRTQREAASQSLANLVSLYRADLTTRGLDEIHVHDTCARIIRSIKETKWQRLNDVRPDSFLSFRSSLRCSPKTVKEYQTSLNAFLNWNVNTGRLAANPLAKIKHVETRGKAVREARSFTFAELLALFTAVAGTPRQLFYRLLYHTGKRLSQVAGLTWSDFVEIGSGHVLVFSVKTAKSKKQRSIPVQHRIARALLELRPPDAKPTDRIFPSVPSYERMRADLVLAGIQHRDASGRVVHFHAIRKTFQTVGANHGVNQRAAQELLDHSDPSLTAVVYTDVNALRLQSEVEKLPWIDNAQEYSQKPPQNVCVQHIPELLGQILAITNRLAAVPVSELSRAVKLGAGAGFEPATFRL